MHNNVKKEERELKMKVPKEPRWLKSCMTIFKHSYMSMHEISNKHVIKVRGLKVTFIFSINVLFYCSLFFKLK